MKNKNILVTGGAGFIGSHIVEKLIEDNKVSVYDNFTRNSLAETNVLNHKNLTIIKGDILDADLLRQASQNIDIVIHCAAIAGIYSVMNNPGNTMKTNLIGTLNVLEAVKVNSIPKLIDFSTSEVYGSFAYSVNEKDNTVISELKEKRGIYSISKLAGEHLSHAYAEEYGFSIASVRPFNIFGPRQLGEGAIQQMISKALAGEDLVVFNEGIQIRAWCYIDDFVEGIDKILNTDLSSNEVFNIGNPQTSITVLNLAKKIIKLTGSASKIVFRKHPGSEIQVRVPDISKASSLLNFNPCVDLEEGLLKAIDWYKDYRVKNI